MSTRSERIQEKAFERRWLILVALCISLLVIVLDNSILNVALVTIQEDLGATASDLQWIVDSYTLVFAGLLLTAGSLGDRFGRRGALQIGFIIFGVGSVASALATTSGQLIGTRAFMGIGGALIMPATLSIITNVFPAGERAKAIGAWAGVAGLGAALGPITGGFLIEHFYWGSIFLVNIPIVIFGVLAGLYVIPTSKDPHAPKLDIVGAVLSIVGLTALLYGIIEAPVKGWTSPETLVVGGLGVVLLVAFGIWELKSSHPMLEVSFFKNPRFSAASGAIMLVFFSMFGAFFLITQYLQYVLGYTALETGIRFLPFAITLMVIAPLSAKVAERFGTKYTVATGLALAGCGLLSMVGLQTDSSYLEIVVRLVAISGGMALTMAPATESVMGSLPLAKAGVGSAVNDTTRQVGGALGVAVLGSVLASVYSGRVGDVFAGSGVSEAAVSASQSSIGAIPQVAEQLTANGFGDLATQLRNAANEAFVQGVHWAVVVAALVIFAGAGVVLAFLPARARREDSVEQHAEYAAEHAGEFEVPADLEPEPDGLAPRDGTATPRTSTAEAPGTAGIPEPAPER
jgi:EmrB/QacA subfamily drug resistance transporter